MSGSTSVSINASGVDTETLIQSSIQSYQTRYDNVYKKKVVQEWTKEAYSDIYSSVKSYWTNDASNYKLSSYTTARTASSSNSDVVTATVNADAIEMSHDVKVASTASAAYLQTYGKIGAGTTDIAKIAGITVPDDKKSSNDVALSFTIGDGENDAVISFTYKDLSDGKTLYDLASRINKSGLNVKAVYDSTNDSFSITNKSTGADNQISLTTDVTQSTDYKDAVAKAATAKATIDANGSFDYAQFESLLKAKTAASDKYNNSDSDATLQQEADDAEAAYNQFIAAQSADIQTALKSYGDAKAVMQRYDVSADYETALIDKQVSLNALNTANGGDYDTEDIDALIEAGDDTAINDYINNVSDTGVQAALRDYADKAKAVNSAKANAQTTDNQYGAALLAAFDFAKYDGNDGSFTRVSTDDLAGGVAGTNASVTIDGKEYTDLQSNTVTVANVTYTFNSVSTSTTKINVSTDVDSLVESVQNFVDGYNKLLDSLNEKLHESTYSDYGALTDDEEEEMTESQLEKWYAKAKSGLLKNSSQIQNIVDSMREALYTSVSGIDGKYTSAYSIGIGATGTYDEYGHLYLDEDTLRAAIAEDPDCVYKIFSTNTKDYDTQGIAYRLSDIMKDGMSSIEDQAGTTSSSDDQSYIGLKIQSYEEQLTSLQDLIDTKYDFYYSKYSAMEEAISNLQSSMNTISSYLGT
jgi:flagellar hook-associated protein 2